MTIIATAGTIIAGILVVTLRTSSKAASITTVRQNGEYALSQMTKMIRFAKNYQGVRADGQEAFTSDCSLSSPDIKYTEVKLTGFDDQETILSCTKEDPPTIASNGATLINTEEVSIVTNESGISCWFACTQGTPADQPKIDINFSLQKKSSEDVVDTQTRVNFHTSVVPRNAVQ